MTLMVGLNDGSEHKSLQMQFFWRYLNRLENENRWSHFGDADSPASSTGDNSLKSSPLQTEVGDTFPLAFEQVKTFFNRLTALEEALSSLAFDYAITKYIEKREHLDLANIASRLHHAIFLENDVMMFERMPAQQIELHTNEHDIIGLAALTLQAIYRELLFIDKGDKQWRLPLGTERIIEDFKDKFHLLSEVKFFSDCSDTFSEEDRQKSILLRQNLRAILFEIDEQTVFKSPDYEDYYYALQGVLQEQLFTIDSLIPAYNQAWEELCVFYYKRLKGEIVWCDFSNISFSFKDLGMKTKDALNPEIFEDIRARWTVDITEGEFPIIRKRPDLVVRYTDRDMYYYEVVDFKHYDKVTQDSIRGFNDIELHDKTKFHADLRSLTFYARAVDNCFNPYGNRSVPPISKKLCFPCEVEQHEEGNNDYFFYESVSTESLMKEYIESYGG